jgi:hypothetical protein
MPISLDFGAGCTDNPSMRTRRPLASAIAFPLIIGIIGLAQLMQRPRFASYHAVDVVQLLGSGMCFGVALVALFMLLRGPRAS